MNRSKKMECEFMNVFVDIAKRTRALYLVRMIISI